MKMTVREKRYLLAGAAIAIAIGLFYVFTSLVPNREKLAGEVELKKRTLAAQREVLLGEETSRRLVQQHGRRLAQLRTRLLPGDNSSVASAELQQALKNFADQSGVEIIQKNTLPERALPDSPDITRVSVRIETRCDLEELVNFLTAIENYDTFLKVEELVINSFRNQRRYEIRPSLTVTGYIGTRSPAPAELSAASAPLLASPAPPAPGPGR